jgi:tetratricopeptide (TPR) repeat protein
LAAQSSDSGSTVRERLHQSEQWRTIEKFLPDPATATPQALEQQADILRARRFPEDAMDYYKYALARGGNAPAILNKLGLTELEMRNVQLAKAYFERSVRLNKKDANAWNNLGAVEYMNGISDNARKDYGPARREIAAALKLDPQIFEHATSNGGVAAHVLTAEDRARLAFEMAKLYARNNQEDEMLHSLAVASESGMDVQREMRHDPVLAKFELDPRVLVLVHNAQALRLSRGASASVGRESAPVLPDTKPVVE